MDDLEAHIEVRGSRGEYLVVRVDEEGRREDVYINVEDDDVEDLRGSGGCGEEAPGDAR